MKTLRTSKYLHTIRRTDGFALVHSLFGQLSLADPRTVEFLETLRQPAPLERIISEHSNGDSEGLASLVGELERRSLLVPADSDEYEAVERDMRFRELCLPSGYLVRALQLILSNRCNFGCKFCFFKDHTSATRLALAGRESNMQMSLDTVKMAVESVLSLQRKHGHRSVNIEFFGGEPLMNWPAIEYVLETFRRAGNDSLPLINYSITTNGKMLNRDMAALFKKYDVTVTVSYNFPTGVGDLDPNEYPNALRVNQSLDTLNEVGNAITFNTVLSLDALEYFDSTSYVDFCQARNVQMIGLILDLNLDFYKDPANSTRAMDAIMATFTCAKEVGIPVVGYWHEPFAQIAGRQALNFHSGFKCCPGEGCKLSVEPEGHVFVCKGCSECIGHISDLEGVLSHPKYKEYAFHAYRNAPECDGCMIENFCSTGCMGSIERHYDSIHAVDPPWCAVFRELTSRLIRQMEPSEFDDNVFSFPSST